MVNTMLNEGLLEILFISCHLLAKSCLNLWQHRLQQGKLPCPSLSPRVCPISCPLSLWCHPTISSSVILFLPSIFPDIRFFSNESALLIRWPKCWNLSFNNSPSNEYWGLTSFRIDRFDFPAVQGILRSLLQNHSLKAAILWCSAFFMVQLSHLYMTTGKTTVLIIWTFVGKVISSLYYAVYIGYSFSSKEQVSFNFVTAVTVHVDFRAQENEIWHFPLFPHLFAMKW